MSARAVPFYCPFCGEQDIRPDDAGTDGVALRVVRTHFELDADRDRR